jgi:glycosyltransferase involved in cell wall biosynthesis
LLADPDGGRTVDGMPSTNDTRPTVEIAAPVLNEAGELARQLRVLRRELDAVTAAPWAGKVTICVADNGSVDGTVAIARSLLDELAPMRVVTTGRRGKGFGVLESWTTSTCDVVAYTDLDLSAAPVQLAGLVVALATHDVAVGSRYLRGARRRRSFARTLTRSLPSRVYRWIMHATLPVPVSDVHCGLKAVRRETVAPVLGELRHGGWFFDTELLVLAAARGLRVTELPVAWVDDPDSRVRVAKVARELLAGVVELRARLASEGRGPR